MGDLTPIAPKLRPLVTLLGSDETSDIILAHRAINKTLAEAGCSWADLAATLVAPPKARKGRRQPRLWPTFGSLSYADRSKWLNLIRDSASTMSEQARVEFEDLRTKIIMRPDESLTQPEVSTFNRLVRAASRKGERI